MAFSTCFFAEAIAAAATLSPGASAIPRDDSTSGVSPAATCGFGVSDTDFCRSDLRSLPIWRSGLMASRSEFTGLSFCASPIVLRTSSRSASFKASSNCLRKSPAMPRIFVVMRPKARSMGGRSFGPTTMISTMAITTNSVQPISSIRQFPAAERPVRMRSAVSRGC